MLKGPGVRSLVPVCQSDVGIAYVNKSLPGKVMVGLVPVGGWRLMSGTKAHRRKCELLVWLYQIKTSVQRIVRVLGMMRQ